MSGELVFPYLGDFDSQLNEVISNLPESVRVEFQGVFFDLEEIFILSIGEHNGPVDSLDEVIAEEPW